MKKIGYKLPVQYDSLGYDTYVSGYLEIICRRGELIDKLQTMLNFDLNHLNGAPKSRIFSTDLTVASRKRSLGIK